MNHLAQINIGRAIAALSDPVMADFVRQLDEVNALAEQNSGFVWRLKSDDGTPSSYIHVFDDPKLLINMSVWKSIEALRDYVYRTDHGKVYADRRKWFEPFGKASFALWWINAGEVPSLEEGLERLEFLWQHGPSPTAFTFKHQFAKCPKNLSI